MSDRVYKILEAIHEDALTEHRLRPTAFSGLVLRAMGEALSELESPFRHRRRPKANPPANKWRP